MRRSERRGILTFFIMRYYHYILTLIFPLGILFSWMPTQAAWVSNCTVYSAGEYNIREGSMSFARPLGINSLCIRQEIDALEGFDIERCEVADMGPNPTNSFRPEDTRCYNPCGGAVCSRWSVCGGGAVLS